MSENIYYFWEPPEGIPAYVSLCLDTWRVAFRAYNIIPLNYANLADHLDTESLTLDDTFKALPLPMQKDAILVAVLHERGGIFLDADTIAVDGPSEIFDRLRKTEVIMLGSHMAFMAARPKARLLDHYLESIRERLSVLQEPGFLDEKLPWHYLANGALQDAIDRLAGTGSRTFHTQGDIPRLSNSSYLNLQQRTVLQRMHRRLSLQFLHRRHFQSLDRERHGFIAEAVCDGLGTTDPRERYLRYWFSTDLPTESAMTNNPAFIGLHHSWTPEWYLKLSKTEVLSHDCLLSRTLKFLIERS